jgi:O-antigen/teichoic acid export membrane protein
MSDTLIGAVRGFKNMEYPVIAKFIVQPIIRLVLIGIAVMFGLRVIHAVAIFFVGELVAALIIFYYLNKLFSLARPISAARADVNEIAKFAIPDWLAGLMDTFRGNIQALLIGALGSFTGVGIFTVSDQLNTIGRDFYSSINTASKPYIAELHDRNEHDKLQRIYQTTNKWSLLVNIPFFLILVLYPVQILSIFGKTFENGALALMIMACANLVDVGTGVGGAMLNMTGYTKLKLFNNIVSLVVSLALNVMLIPYFGVVGAALSALVVMAVLNTLRIVQVYRLLKLFPYNITFLKPLLAAIITGFVSYFLNKLYPIDSYLIHLAVHVSVLFAIFAFSIFILGLDPEDQQMVNRILGKSFRFFQRNK